MSTVTDVHVMQLLSSAPLPPRPQKHGLVIIPEGTPNGDISHEQPASGITVVTQESAQVLESAGEGPLGECTGGRPAHRA